MININNKTNIQYIKNKRYDHLMRIERNQAIIPECNNQDYLKERQKDDYDKCILSWNKDALDSDTLQSFFRHCCRPSERGIAYDVLNECNYDLYKSAERMEIVRIQNFYKKKLDEKKFEDAFIQYGKNFNQIKKEFNDEYTLKELVSFYYKWKKTYSYTKIKSMLKDTMKKENIKKKFLKKTLEIECEDAIVTDLSPIINNNNEISDKKFKEKPMIISEKDDIVCENVVSSRKKTKTIFCRKCKKSKKFTNSTCFNCVNDTNIENETSHKDVKSEISTKRSKRVIYTRNQKILNNPHITKLK